MKVYELNLDGLVGPSHHYAGLAEGNIASQNNRARLSSPQTAARQGIAKMRFLHSKGLKQALVVPHQRPNLKLMQQLGFTGSPEQQLQKISKYPDLLSICYSASSMWTANAATVAPSCDTKDHKVHFTAANLLSHLHRAQEAAFSKQFFELIFSDKAHFIHHDPLPSAVMMSDEGAANHSRICQTHGSLGLHLFVYGKSGSHENFPKKYPARQSLEASQAIARLHQLPKNRVIFAKQNPEAIDQGVFHNDVIAVANESLLFIHEEAFCEQEKILNQLRSLANFPLTIIEVPKARISIQEAVDSYLFNSQILSLNQGMILVAPMECQENPKINAYINDLIDDKQNPLNAVSYLNLRESMKNGGGPACLRLRLPLNEAELAAMHSGILVTNERLDRLDNWVLKHYRTELTAADLADPALMRESFNALDDLTQLLKLGPIYPFQG